jgi:hypothetical protein
MSSARSTGGLNLAVNYQSFELPGEPGLRFNVFTAEPDTPNQEALRFLASWAAANPRAVSESPRATDINARPNQS